MNSLAISVERCSHLNFVDSALFIGDILSVYKYTGPYSEISESMKKLNDVMMMWLEHLKVLPPLGEHT